jgi:recombination protein RecA
MYGEGISKIGDIIDCGVAMDIVEKAGAWYSFEGERIGQGRENAKVFLQSQPQMLERIQKLVYEKLERERNPKAEEPAKEDVKKEEEK